MAKTFLLFSVLIAVLSLTCTNATAQDSTVYSQQDSLLRATEAEQIRFNVTYLNMNRLWAENRVLRKEVAERDTIIDLYGRETGIYKTTIPLMKQNFALKDGICKDAVPKLAKCNEDLLVFRPRAKRRAWSLVIAVPVAAIIGYSVGSLIN